MWWWLIAKPSMILMLIVEITYETGTPGLNNECPTVPVCLAQEIGSCKPRPL